MPFVSYAENQEDVLLYRALGHLSAGHFVDIHNDNAQSFSVTKAFSTRRWSGLNIEVPSPLIASWTLASALENCVYPEIHFLRIHVPGGEARIIQSGDWQRIRPWIILVHTHNTSSPETQQTEFWETVLTDRRYRYIASDGVNRFYLAQEQLPLLQQYFRYPINSRDDFIRYRELTAETTLQLQMYGFEKTKSGADAKLVALKHELKSVNEAQARIYQAFQQAEQAHANALAALERIRHSPLAALRNFFGAISRRVMRHE